MDDVWPSVSAKPGRALFPKRLRGPNLYLSNLENISWATIVSAFPRNYAVLWKVQRFLYLIKIMHFLQKVQLCYSCLIDKGLERLRMTKDSNMYMTLNGCSRRGHQSWYIFTKRWSAPVLCTYPENPGTKGWFWFRVLRIHQNLPEPSPNPKTGQEPELWVPVFELTSNFPTPLSFTLNYPEPKLKGGSFTHN
jgi:hypothetical protein